MTGAGRTHLVECLHLALASRDPAQLITSLASSAPDRRGRRALRELAGRIAAGTPIADALDTLTPFLPPEVLGLVMVGLKRDDLPAAMAEAHRALARLDARASLFRSVLVQPLIAYLSSALVVALVCPILLPEVASLLGSEPPSPATFATTAVVMLASHPWLWTLPFLVPVAAIALILLARQVPRGRMELDRIVLRLPLVGAVERGRVTLTASGLAASCLSAGLDPPALFEQLARHVANRYAASGLTARVALARQGHALAGLLGSHMAFAGDAGRLLAASEGRARLGDALDAIHCIAVEQYESRLVAVRGPLLVLGVALSSLLVSAIVIVVYLTTLLAGLGLM